MISSASPPPRPPRKQLPASPGTVTCFSGSLPQELYHPRFTHNQLARMVSGRFNGSPMQLAQEAVSQLLSSEMHLAKMQRSPKFGGMKDFDCLVLGRGGVKRLHGFLACWVEPVYCCDLVLRRKDVQGVLRLSSFGYVRICIDVKLIMHHCNN